MRDDLYEIYCEFMQKVTDANPKVTELYTLEAALARFFQNEISIRSTIETAVKDAVTRKREKDLEGITNATLAAERKNPDAYKRG